MMKEFLEKPCFTPDCGGVVVKIQNIDKKGDLSKEVRYAFYFTETFLMDSFCLQCTLLLLATLEIFGFF